MKLLRMVQSCNRAICRSLEKVSAMREGSGRGPERAPLNYLCSLTFLGLTTVRNLTASASWREAKLAVQQGRVRVAAYAGSLNHPHVQIQGTVEQTDSNGKGFMSFCHCRKPAQAYTALVKLDSTTGEVVDCDTSCCPGGYNPVLANFCPCVAAVLLASCKQQQQFTSSKPELMVRRALQEALRTWRQPALSL
jgi:hypothetical protein